MNIHFLHHLRLAMVTIVFLAVSLPASASIAFPEIGTKTNIDPPFSLNATASNGQPVVYEIISDGNIATVSGNVVTLTGASGAVTIRASQSVGDAGSVVVTFIVGDGGFEEISLGSNYAIGIKTDGSLWVWGFSQLGVLGTSAGQGYPTPVRFGNENDWAFISAGQSHAAAIKNDGTLWTWGYNGFGQLGDGTTDSRAIPQQVGAGAVWVSVSAGAYSTLAVMNDGTLWAWGANYYGLLGDGTTNGRLSPVQVGSDTHWSSASISRWAYVSWHHSLGLKTDGSLWAWGTFVRERFGDGSTRDATSPLQIENAYDWTAIDAGGGGTGSSRMLKSDGTLWTLGEGSSSPMAQVGTENDWTKASAGGWHTLAIRNDGSLWGWGDNSTGAVDGSAQTYFALPSRIGLASDWAKIDAGYSHSIALKTDGSIWSWGRESYGTMGHEPANAPPGPGMLFPAKSPQSIVITPPATGLVEIAESITLAADATSGLSVVFSVTGPANLSGNLLTVTGPGEIQVTANQGGDASWAAAAPVSLTLNRAAMLEVRRPDGAIAVSGEAFDFGPNLIGAERTMPVTIRNTGNFPLNNISISITGDGIDAFALESLPASSTLSGGDEAVFTIRFSPSSSGLKSAVLEITSDDPANSPFVGNLSGSRIDTLSAHFNAPSDIAFSTNGFTATGTSFSGLTLGFAPTSGTELILVQNTGSAPIQGTLTGLPEGGMIWANHGNHTYYFSVSYVGGEGNDLVIVAVPPPLDFPAIGAKVITDPPFELNATASNGQPVIYEIISGGNIATVSGNTVTLTGTPGAVTIRVSQASGEAEPVVVTFIVGDAGFEKISLGQSYVLAIKRDGSLWFWGRNPYGQGGGQPVGLTRIGGDYDWRDISAGDGHAVGLKNDGSLWTWGHGGFGQLGDGISDYRESPVKVGNETDWSSISAGSATTYAIKSNGTLWAWGMNFWGQLGDGTTEERHTPTQIGTDTDWSQVSAARWEYPFRAYTLALKTGGTAWAWGLNLDGVPEEPLDRTSPGQVGGGTDWIAVDAGARADGNLAKRSDGSLWKLGVSPGVSDVQVGTETDWTVFSAGGGFVSGGVHALGCRGTGSLWSWGANNTGQLGDGTLDSRSLPGQIGNATDWVAVDAGHGHSIALKNDGSLWSWGLEGWGSLGRYPEESPPYPTRFFPQKAAQEIHFTPPLPATLAVGMSITLSGSASSGLPVTYSLSGPAELQGNLLTVTGLGEIRLTASQQGDDSWQPAESIVSLNNPAKLEIRMADGSPLMDGASLAFDVCAVGAERNMALILASISDQTVEHVSLSLGGQNSETFSIMDSPVPPIPAGGTVVFTVRFAPSSSGGKQAAMEISSNDSLNSPISLSLVGEAVVAATIFDSWVGSTGLSGEDALSTATPFGDGVKNLLKYAFNMNGGGPDVSVLSPGTGTSGLPAFVFDSSGPEPVLRVEFLRRKGSGLVYTPMFSSSLDPESFAPMTGTPSVIDVDDQWERVVLRQPSDPDTAPTCFGVVRVLLP